MSTQFKTPAFGSVSNKKPRGQSAIVHVLWILILLMVTAPHAKLLTGGDYFSVSEVASPYYSYFRRLVGIACFFIVARRFQSSIQLLLKARFFVPFLFLAFVGVAWSVSIRISAVAIIDHLTMVLAALAAAVSMTPERLARTIVHLMGVTLVLCVISVILLPQYAVVQFGELPGSGVPGEWRGMYGSKNALGHVAGIYTGALALFGRKYFWNAASWLFCVFCGASCVVLSHSTSAVVIIAAQLATAWWIGSRKSLGLTLREVVIVFCAAILALYAEVIVGGLLALSGKDITFSGRNLIWTYALQTIRENVWVGVGYGYTSSAEFSAELQAALSWRAAVHFHNAFLDMAFNVGLPAAVLFFGVYLWAPVRSLSLDLAGDVIAARALFISILGGWFASCMTEIDSVRPVSAVALIGLVAAFGLYAIPRQRRTQPLMTAYTEASV